MTGETAAWGMNSMKEKLTPLAYVLAGIGLASLPFGSGWFNLLAVVTFTIIFSKLTDGYLDWLFDPTKKALNGTDQSTR